MIASLLGRSLAAALLVGVPWAAVALPVGVFGVGNVGITRGDGDVGAPPAFGPRFYYLSTSGGARGGGYIPSAAGNNHTGSKLVSKTFTAAAGDELRFFFNYVSTDGGDYPDYAWSILEHAGTKERAAVLFTARTKPSGPIVPGQWLPPADATFTPGEVYMKPGAPKWSKLGGSNGACFTTGCGSTGWIESTYAIKTPGSYRLLFGVTNWTDDAYDSALAVAGARLGDVDITPVPLPPAGLLALGGVGALALVRRRRTAARR